MLGQNGCHCSRHRGETSHAHKHTLTQAAQTPASTAFCRKHRDFTNTSSKCPQNTTHTHTQFLTHIQLNNKTDVLHIYRLRGYSPGWMFCCQLPLLLRVIPRTGIKMLQGRVFPDKPLKKKYEKKRFIGTLRVSQTSSLQSDSRNEMNMIWKFPVVMKGESGYGIPRVPLTCVCVFSIVTSFYSDTKT